MIPPFKCTNLVKLDKELGQYITNTDHNYWQILDCGQISANIGSLRGFLSNKKALFPVGQFNQGVKSQIDLSVVK